MSTPIAVLKKKISNDQILYKIQWSNGTTSSEPLTELSHDALQLAQDYELKLFKSHEEPPVRKQVKPDQKYDLTQKFEEAKRGHQPRVSANCQVKSIRNLGQKVEFQVYYPKDNKTHWLSLEEIKAQGPIALCDYLLAKVKFGGNKK